MTLSYRNQSIDLQWTGFYMITASVMKELSKERLQSKLKEAGESVAVQNSSKQTHDGNKQFRTYAREEEADP